MIRQRLRRLWPAAAAILLFCALLSGAEAARGGALNGLMLAFGVAIPALFPFFVAGSLLNDTGVTNALGRVLAQPMHFVYGLPGAAAGALLLGFTGGYPVGVQAAADLYRAGYLTKAQTERLLGFCNNTGPAFIIGMCGVGVFGSVKTGMLLYCIHVLSAMLAGLALTSPGIGAPPPTALPQRCARPKFSSALVGACERAAQTSIKVGAFITLFSVFAALLDNGGVIGAVASMLSPICRLLGLPPDAAWPLVYGALELTRGLAILPETMLPLQYALPLASALLAFGGLSVWCQSMSLAADAKLSLRRCLFGKVLHAAIASGLATIWCAAAPTPVAVFAPAAALPMLPFGMRAVPIIFILFTITSGKRRQNTL